MNKLTFLGLLAAAWALVCGDALAEPLSFNVPAGETNAYTSAIGSDVTAITKAGGGRLHLAQGTTQNAFAGTISIDEGTLGADTPPITIVVDDEISTVKFIPRETLRRVSTPQAYKFGKLLWGYKKAFAEEIGIYGSSYTNTMMVELGERLYFAAGSDKNIKLTTKDDLEMFKAYLKSDKDNWLK